MVGISMKTEEDEAFDEIARKQGHWGGGFMAKRAMAADKLQEPVCDKDPQGCWNVRCQLGKQCKNLAQPAQEPRKCGLCGENQPFTGTCGGGKENPRALCFTPPAAQPAQEPVAHLWECLGKWSAYLVTNGKQADCAPPSWLVEAIQNATAPPKREWIGLTEKEAKSFIGFYKMDIARLVEAKLKEKNT